MSYRTLDNINTSPYFDDFSDAKNFIQVLFKPGYPVQARELTQLQSILQNQISKMSDHVFKDGAVVYGGKVNVTNYGYLRVKTDSIKLNLNGGTIISPAPDFTNDAVCRSYFFKNLNGSAVETNKVGTNFTPIVATNAGSDYNTRATISALADDFQIEIVDLIPKTATDDLILVYRFVKGSTEHIKNFTINSSKTLRLGEVSKPSSSSTLSLDNSIDRGVINNFPIIFDIRERLYVAGGGTQESNILVENVNDLLRVSITPGIVYKDGIFRLSSITQQTSINAVELVDLLNLALQQIQALVPLPQGPPPAPA